MRTDKFIERSMTNDQLTHRSVDDKLESTFCFFLQLYLPVCEKGKFVNESVIEGKFDKLNANQCNSIVRAYS